MIIVGTPKRTLALRLICMLSLIFVIDSLSMNLGGRAQPVPLTKLSAPDYYIAARAEYREDSSTIHVRGATNLPVGAVISIEVEDRIGKGSAVLSEHILVTVNVEGYFESDIPPKRGMALGHNTVCDIVFMPQFPTQPKSVLAAVGNDGQNLDFPRNPQAQIHSGETYLSDTIHVP